MLLGLGLPELVFIVAVTFLAITAAVVAVLKLCYVVQIRNELTRVSEKLAQLAQTQTRIVETIDKRDHPKGPSDAPEPQPGSAEDWLTDEEKQRIKKYYSDPSGKSEK
jgi:hypothetical protein